MTLSHAVRYAGLGEGAGDPTVGSAFITPDNPADSRFFRQLLAHLQDFSA
jgi:hypothetical protein